MNVARNDNCAVSMLNTKRQRTIVIGVGIATFFFGFGGPAILNLYLLAVNSALVLQFRSSLTYTSSILGDGIILPIVNMFAVLGLFKNQELIGRLPVILSLFFGLLITAYFHVVQGAQGLINWSMPKPWQWNFLGVWHAFYMFTVSSLIILFYIVLTLNIAKRKRITKEAVLVTLGIVLFIILLRLDYIDVNLL